MPGNESQQSEKDPDVPALLPDRIEPPRDDIVDLTQTGKVAAVAILAAAEQEKGFKNVEEYEAAVIAGNDKVRNEAKHYIETALASLLYAHSAEDPHALILFECADGRNGGAEMFSKDDKVRFPVRWRPMAGLMLFSRVTALLHKDATRPLAERLDELLSDKTAKEELWAEARALFEKDLEEYETLARAATFAGKRVLGVLSAEEATINSLSLPQNVRGLAKILEETSGKNLKEKATPKSELVEKMKKMKEKETFPITIELQSHSADMSGENGCGAHGSRLQEALTLPAMNALVLERFLREEYPNTPQRDIRIALTHHFTGKNEQVVDVYKYNLEKDMDPSIRGLIERRGHFSATFLKDAVNGIVRVGKKENAENDREQHDEYIVRVSEYHKAVGLPGTSVLEQSMLPDLDQMESIVMTLLNIAKDHRIKREPNQPLFLRLDEPADNPEVARRYKQLYKRLMENHEIQEMIAQNKLFVVRSRTEPFSFTDENRLKTTFMD